MIGESSREIASASNLPAIFLRDLAKIVVESVGF